MQGKDAIIEKIINDANQSAKMILDDASKIATERKQDAEAWASEYSSAQKKQVEKAFSDIVDRRKIVANLDVKKNILKAKQDVIGDTFSLVVKKLQSLKKKEYLKFVAKLIGNNADYGDKIVLSNDGVISKDEILALDVVKEKNLTIDSKHGDFVGGVMLVSDKCDKDLSFRSIVEDKKEELYSFVVEGLF